MFYCQDQIWEKPRAFVTAYPQHQGIRWAMLTASLNSVSRDFNTRQVGESHAFTRSYPASMVFAP